jgi:hypothetical protein
VSIQEKCSVENESRVFFVYWINRKPVIYPPNILRFIIEKQHIQTVGKPRTDSVPPTMQSQIPKSRDVTLFFLDMTLYK